MLQPFEPDKVTRIVRNILDSCVDVTCLSEEAYRWIHLRAGFITQFCRSGFIEEYQTSQNLRECILAYQHANTHCNRRLKDPDYPYYRQQCAIYQQIVDHLNANPIVYRQKKRTDNFSLELSTDTDDKIHQLTLITKRGTSTVYCDSNFLVNLQDQISQHLNASKP